MTEPTSPARILIVDDSEDSADITAAFLESGGFGHLSVARSAAEAFEMMGVGSDAAPPGTDIGFDLVIMDIRMPEIDGIEACARMRLDPASRHVPILMLSGVREVQALNQAFVAGANDFVSKPVTEIALLARVRTLLRFGREQRRRQLRETELKKLNRDLQRGSLDATVIDPLTRMASGIVVEMTLRNCRENGDPAALALVQIDEFASYMVLHGAEAGDKLAQRIAALVAGAPAPLMAIPCYYGEGAFMVVQPGADGDRALTEACDAIRDAVETAALPHGNSPNSEIATVSTRAARAEGEALDTLGMRLIADLERARIEGANHVATA